MNTKKCKHFYFFKHEKQSTKIITFMGIVKFPFKN